MMKNTNLTYRNSGLSTKHITYGGRCLLILFTLFSMASCKKASVLTSGGAPAADNAESAKRLNTLTTSNPFKVLSFNIRRDQPGDPETITQRRTKIKQIIVDNDPDIFGLQEFQDDSIKTWFESQMASLGYDGFYATPTGSSPKAIFFKHSRYTMQSNGIEKLGDPPISDKAYWVVLLDNVTSKKYFVVNSHWSPDDEATRNINVARLVAMVNRENTAGLPLICFGDFNTQPGTAPLNTLKTDLDVEDAMGDSEGGLTFHGWDATGDSKIDYIMLSRDLSYSGSTVIQTSYSGKWPSDHWPVMSTIMPAILGAEHVDAAGLSASSSTQYYFADVNGDGKADKIFWRPTYNSGIPRVYLSNGNGTFVSTPVDHTAGASTLSSTHYYYADVNGDGKADEIFWDPTLNSGKTKVFLATSAGNFSSTAIVNSEGLSAVAATVFNFADVNGDGKADKIFWRYNYDSGQPRVFLATSGGSFNSTYVPNPDNGVSTTDGTQFWYTDVNGDGKADKVMWYSTLNSGKVMVYLSDGDGTFTMSSGYSNSGLNSGTSTTQFFMADLNGDGKADKIFWRPTYYLGRLAVNYANSSGFDAAIFSIRGTSESANTQYFFADISGDGKKDQIRWNYAENSGKQSNFFGTN